MTTGIYKIINKINKKYYLGSAQDTDKRWKQHKSDLKKQRHVNIILQRAWNKYGSDNFEMIVIDERPGCKEAELLAIEQEYLNKLDNNAYNISKGAYGGDNLTNHPDRDAIIARMTVGVIERYASMTEDDWIRFSNSRKGEKNGMFGRTHTKEARKLISEANIKYNLEHENYRAGKTFEELFGEEEAARLRLLISETASQRIGEKNPFYGKTHTSEAIDAMSKAKKGKYYGSQNIPIIVNDKRYESLGEASKDLGIPLVTIRWRVLSKNKKFSNYRYANENS